MPETLSRHDIELRVVDIVAAALDQEPAAVRLHDSLIDDLGAESIDFLDIQFRIESGFGIRVSENRKTAIPGRLRFSRCVISA